MCKEEEKVQGANLEWRFWKKEVVKLITEMIVGKLKGRSTTFVNPKIEAQNEEKKPKSSKIKAAKC